MEQKVRIRVIGRSTRSDGKVIENNGMKKRKWMTIKENSDEQPPIVIVKYEASRCKMCLTEIRVTNHEIIVFSQYRIKKSDTLRSNSYVFRNRYVDTITCRYHALVFWKSMKWNFVKKMHSDIYKAAKTKCINPLASTETVSITIQETMSRKLYLNLQKRVYVQRAGFRVNAANILTKFLYLSQIAGGHFIDDKNHFTEKRTKQNLRSEITASAIAVGRALLVMARYALMIYNIWKYWKR